MRPRTAPCSAKFNSSWLRSAQPWMPVRLECAASSPPPAHSGCAWALFLPRDGRANAVQGHQGGGSAPWGSGPLPRVFLFFRAPVSKMPPLGTCLAPYVCRRALSDVHIVTVDLPPTPAGRRQFSDALDGDGDVDEDDFVVDPAVASEVQLPAHACVLAARSPYFAAMLGARARWLESCASAESVAAAKAVRVTQYRAVVLRAVLRFLYSDDRELYRELRMRGQAPSLPPRQRLCRMLIAARLGESSGTAPSGARGRPQRRQRYQTRLGPGS